MTTTVNADTSRVFDVIRTMAPGKSYTIHWTIVTEDAFGGQWEARFNSFDGMGGTDDFGNALVQASAWPIDPTDNDNVVTLHCEYVETTDTYNVRFGERVVPLSIFSWTKVG